MKRVGLDYSVRLLLTHEQYGRDQDGDGDSCLLEATILGFEFPYAFGKGLEIKVVRLHHTSCWLHSLTLREGRTKRNVGRVLAARTKGAVDCAKTQRPNVEPIGLKLFQQLLGLEMKAEHREV